MNAVVRALFDDAAITGAQAAGLKDTSTAAMRAAVREWFELFFMREAVKGKDEDPAQRIPYTITNKLTKACFAEYDSSFTENGTGKTAWLDGQRSLIDAEKQDVLQWVMVGGEGFLKPAPDGTGRLAYHVVRRDCYNVLARGPRGITDVLMSERSRAGSDYYTLLERRTVDGSGYLTIRYKLYTSKNSSTLGQEVRLDSLPQYAALAPEHTYSVPFGGLGMTYIRLPMANNVDGSPDGVSVYEGAVQLIHNIYKNEYQLGREFELGRSRIVAGSDMLMTPGPEGPGRALPRYAGAHLPRLRPHGRGELRRAQAPGRHGGHAGPGGRRDAAEGRRVRRAGRRHQHGHDHLLPHAAG